MTLKLTAPLVRSKKLECARIRADSFCRISLHIKHYTEPLQSGVQLPIPESAKPVPLAVVSLDS